MSESASRKRTVLITGATGGLGRELCREFRVGGFDVIGLYRKNDGMAEALQRELDPGMKSAVFLKQDIASDDGWERLDSIIEERPDSEITVIANASSYFTPRPLHLLTAKDFEELFEVNVFGTVRLLERSLPAMARRKSGLFVSVLSKAMDPPAKGFAAYAAAKSALRSLTRSVSAEYGARGIRAFSVSPGFMRTPLTEQWSEHLKATLEDEREPGPAEVAKRIRELSEDPDTGHRGEDYPV